MKLKHPARYLICLAALPLSLCLTHCSNDKDCADNPQKDNLYNKSFYFPYKGNETLKFLHNNTDTQTFVSQGVETFFVRETQTESGCPIDYESLRTTFKNASSNDLLRISFERDHQAFSDIIDFNIYTFYKIRYKGIELNKLFKYVSNKDSMNINGHYYNDLYIVGSDTVNYSVFVLNKGLVKVKIHTETWELVN